MTWIDYLVTIAAPHSKYNARHWFRYLRKVINEDISKEQINELYNNSKLTAFQRVTLKAAFTEGSPTRMYIISLNEKIIPTKLAMVMSKYENRF